ncbi:MAG TPA: VOC family protein [Opitutaceae bacterium]|nr:VOC family protein [Opitutaceae bacterium]
MNAILGGGGFHHICIKTRDWERTMRFYRETLGCVEKVAWRTAPNRAAMLDVGDGNYLEVFEDASYAPAPNGAVLHFALRTTNLDAVAQRVRDFGAKITMEPKDVTIPNTATGSAAAPPSIPIRIFFCEGPSGEVVEFFQNVLT